MTKVTTVASLKGGGGKSTITINLATAAQMAGIHTVIIDIDPDQQAASKWSDSRESEQPLVLSAVYSRLSHSIAEAEQSGAKLIFIDTPAFEQKILSAAVLIADLVLIPCRPTAQDVQYLTATTDVAAMHQKPAAIVMNQVEPRLPETENRPSPRPDHQTWTLPLAHASVQGLRLSTRHCRRTRRDRI
jgi:chromosome partitioning protein